MTDYETLAGAAAAMDAAVADQGLDESMAISAALYVAARRAGAIAQDHAALGRLQELLASQVRELCAIEFRRGIA